MAEEDEMDEPSDEESKEKAKTIERLLDVGLPLEAVAKQLASVQEAFRNVVLVNAITQKAFGENIEPHLRVYAHLASQFQQMWQHTEVVAKQLQALNIPTITVPEIPEAVLAKTDSLEHARIEAKLKEIDSKIDMLIKSLSGPEFSEEDKKRAKEALEEIQKVMYR